MADTDVGNGAEAEMKEEVVAENGNGNGVDKEDSTEVDKVGLEWEWDLSG